MRPSLRGCESVGGGETREGGMLGGGLKVVRTTEKTMQNQCRQGISANMEQYNKPHILARPIGLVRVLCRFRIKKIVVKIYKSRSKY